MSRSPIPGRGGRARRKLAAALALLISGGIVAVRALTEPKNDFHFSILGDRTGDAKPGVYSRVWREVDLLHPDFVINVGDTIQRGPDSTVQPQWDRLHTLFERYRHFPLYFTPGNHDVFSETSRAIYERESGRPLYYSFNYQEAHFTVLDNSRTLELSPGQLRFLEADLQAHRDRRPKFVFFHKPYWILPLRLRGGEFALHELCRRHGVTYVISGHGHQFMRLERDGIVYMEVGSSGGRLRGLERGEGFAEGWFYHHVWVRVRGSRVQCTVMELPEPFGRGRRFRAEEWREDGPSFPLDDPAAAEASDL